MESASPRIAIDRFLASRGINPGYVIGLDSATAQLKATAQFLQGQELKSGGFAPSVLAALLDAVSHLPLKWSQRLSTLAGWMDASPVSVLNRVRSDVMARWVVEQYPKRRYPAMMIGSSNGAATHLCTALGIPWLPQTLLVCVRHTVDIDQPKQELAWSKVPTQQLLRHNPDLKAYQMHDANQDRLKVGNVSYFRLKRTRLGKEYEQFIQQNIAPGGTLLLLECTSTWLGLQVDDRHFFQFGGEGTLTSDDYFEQSPQIAEFLQKQGSKHRYWDVPTPNGRHPESEWGFDDDLRQDIERFAQEHSLKVRRIVFEDAQDLSPLVAELYRWWYQQRGLPSDRLFIQSFAFLQPWLTLQRGLVPFWAVFNDRGSASQLNAYLDTAKPYDEIYQNLFSNGLCALGQASIGEWRSILQRARTRGQFLGVNEQTYPMDMSSFIRHYTDLKHLSPCYPMPEPLTLQQLDQFLEQTDNCYSVRWIDSPTT